MLDGDGRAAHLLVVVTQALVVLQSGGEQGGHDQGLHEGDQDSAGEREGHDGEGSGAA